MLIQRPLNSFDLHFTFSDSQKTLKCFDSAHKLRYTLECRNDTVNEGYGHNGKCPPGQYILGEPVFVNSISFGEWFIPLHDPEGNWIPEGRGEIGIHGGGSGLADPFAPRQGWVITLGCLRMQNEDLAKVADSVNYTYEHGGTPYLTVGE